jgi:hypothetical protein
MPYPGPGGTAPPAPTLLKGHYLRVDGYPYERFESLPAAQGFAKDRAPSAKIHVYNAWHRRLGEAS